MSALTFDYVVPGDDFTQAGAASSDVKRKLKQIGCNADVIRRVAIAMYEGEINMVIHAGGGTAHVEIDPDKIYVVLEDHGPGIQDLSKAMKERTLSGAVDHPSFIALLKSWIPGP